VAVKEEHAEKVKHEVQVIWSDYFKPEHLAAFPELHTKVWNLLQAGRQEQAGRRRAGGGRPRGATEEFADMFWRPRSSRRSAPGSTRLPRSAP